MTKPEVPAHVVRKLIYFSLAMIVLPLCTFFVCNGMGLSSIWSGGAAALVANVVLIGYVIVAFTEDMGDTQSLKAKKDQ